MKVRTFRFCTRQFPNLPEKWGGGRGYHYVITHKVKGVLFRYFSEN